MEKLCHFIAVQCATISPRLSCPSTALLRPYRARSPHPETYAIPPPLKHFFITSPNSPPKTANLHKKSQTGEKKHGSGFAFFLFFVLVNRAKTKAQDYASNQRDELKKQKTKTASPQTRTEPRFSSVPSPYLSPRPPFETNPAPIVTRTQPIPSQHFPLRYSALTLPPPPSNEKNSGLLPPVLQGIKNKKYQQQPEQQQERQHK